MADIAKIQRAIARAEAAGDAPAVQSLRQTLAEAQYAAENAPKPQVGRDMSDVLSSAMTNFGPSLANYGKDVLTAVTNPIDTIGALGDVGAGALREGARAVLPETVFNAIDSVGNQSAAERASVTAGAVGNYYKGRWGSVEGFKKALAEDPVGVLSDLSLPVTGAGGLATRAAGTTSRIGRIGRMVSAAGDFMDPVSGAIRTGRAGGRAAGGFAGWVSGIGDEPVMSTFDAHRAGGPEREAVIRGRTQPPRSRELVNEAMSKADVLSQEASNRYDQGMQATLNSNANINWNNVFRSIYDTIQSNTTRKGGRFTGGPMGRQTIQEMLDVVHQYVQDPALHNLEGLDGLKRELSLLQHPIGPQPVRGAENANRLITNVINGVRDEIIRLEPSYGDAMLDYSEFGATRDELRRALKLNDKAAWDTTLRALQSTQRNNVQTNYGARTSLLDELDTATAPAIPPRPGSRGRPQLDRGTLRAELAGQATNTWMPRGIARAGSAMTIPMMGAFAVQNPWLLGSAIPFLPFASPRTVGAVTGLLGDAARNFDNVAAAAPKTAATVRAATGRTGRQINRQAGVIENKAEGVFQDSKGRWFDINGKPVP